MKNMQIDLFNLDNVQRQTEHDITRAEVPFVHKSEEQYKIIILDADDTLDVIIHYPTGEREAIWSLVKE